MLYDLVKTQTDTTAELKVHLHVQSETKVGRKWYITVFSL